MRTACKGVQYTWRRMGFSILMAQCTLLMLCIILKLTQLALCLHHHGYRPYLSAASLHGSCSTVPPAFDAWTAGAHA